MPNGDRTAWAVCVSTTEEPSPSAAGKPAQRSRVDYKEVLSEEDFRVFADLRALRKELAEQEGVPPYAVFNNEQLAAIVTRCVRTNAELRTVPGVGPGRVDKYGPAFLARLAELAPTKES